MLQGANLSTFNRLWEAALRGGIRAGAADQGHTFKLSCFLHFILLAALTFFQDSGLGELLEKIEFSKGTGAVRAQGIRISFISKVEGAAEAKTDTLKPL